MTTPDASLLRAVKVTWKDAAGKYTNGADAYLGRVCVGSVIYSAGTKPKGSTEPPWEAVSHLPGLRMKRDTTSFATIDEAKERLERFIATWFAAIEKETP
jgi:hypothetical protein